MRIDLDDDHKMEIPMGPMIDCVFLLLLYFMAASTIKLDEMYLGLSMPSGASASKESLPAELKVTILESGDVLCNDLPVGNRGDRDLEALHAKLKQVIELFGPKQPVVVHPQPRVRQQRIVDVLNACSRSGVKNLSFFANQ